MKMNFDFDNFDPDNPPEGMPPELIAEIIKAKEVHDWSKEGRKKIKEVVGGLEGELEKTVFMEYWRHLGNHAESYQTSFQQASSFWKALRAVRKACKFFDVHERPRMLTALAETMVHMAGIYEASANAKAEHDAKAPKIIAKLMREREQED